VQSSDVTMALLPEAITRGGSTNEICKQLTLRAPGVLQTWISSRSQILNFVTTITDELVVPANRWRFDCERHVMMAVPIEEGWYDATIFPDV